MYISPKAWLFGGSEIPVSNALFDVSDYDGVVVSDLFGDEQYFADSERFWDHQNKAVAALADKYADDGWDGVVVLDVGTPFSKWEHVKAAKENGGKVYIRVSCDGEVEVFEGLISEKEARKRQRKQAKADGEGEDKPVRPELTKAMQNYLDLHRHAAVRAKLLDHPKIALRLCVAQIIAGSSRWDVIADPQRADSKTIAKSLEDNSAQDVFAMAQTKVMDKLGIAADTERPLVYHMPVYGRGLDVHAVFAKLMTLDDKTVMGILTYVVAETLDSGSAMIEGLGAMLKEIGGKAVADGNVTETAKVQKQIIRDFLKGENGRDAKPDPQPRSMAFPMKTYTKRGGIGAISAYKAVKRHYPVR